MKVVLSKKHLLTSSISNSIVTIYNFACESIFPIETGPKRSEKVGLPE